MNLTNYYMESLAKIHAPSSDTKNLWKFGDLCEANIRGLETLGVMTNSHTPKEEKQIVCNHQKILT